MKTIYIRYHKIMFFLQWLKFYLKHIKSGLKAIFWSISVAGWTLSFKECVDVLKWNSWERYQRQTYFITDGDRTWMFPGEHLEQSLSVHYDNIVFSRKIKLSWK